MRLTIGRSRPKVGSQSIGRDAEEATMLARIRRGFDVLVRRRRPHEETDLEEPSGTASGVTHRMRFVQLQGHRCLAKDMLAARERRDDEVVVDWARQAN